MKFKKPQTERPDYVYDVVIYGATPAGLAAAIQAQRMGASAVIIEPSDRIGGLTTGGLGQTDVGGNLAAFGGIAWEFYHAVWQYYRDPTAWKFQKPEEFTPHNQFTGGPTGETLRSFEPHAALEILEQWEKDRDLTIHRGLRLDRFDADGTPLPESPVAVAHRRIAALRTDNGKVYAGKIFIDATYEGDLMFEAGVSVTTSREANFQFDESCNGAQYKRAIHHQFEPGVSPYVVPGDPQSGLLPFVSAPEDAFFTDGMWSRCNQAYNYRLCLTDAPDNRIPFAKPDGYDEKDFELLLRNYEAGAEPVPPVNFSPLPNRKTDSNNSGAVSTDFIGGNHDYLEASYQEREKILKTHLYWVQGLMWTAANHPRVPETVRREMSRWGTCKDEFTKNGGWSPVLYVREGRRMISDYVMTEHNIRMNAIAEMPVACGVYQIDSHNAQRYVGYDGFVHNEGDIQDPRRTLPGDWATAYGIDYRSIVPARRECRNLIVPVCLSATHTAYGSIRMEPVFFALGQAAGTAAALAVKHGCDAQRVDYEELKTELLKYRQVIRDERYADLVANQGVGIFSPDGRVEMRIYAKPAPRVTVYIRRAEAMPPQEIADFPYPGDTLEMTERKIAGKTPDDAREIAIKYSSGAVAKIYCSDDKVRYVATTAEGREITREWAVGDVEKGKF